MSIDSVIASDFNYRLKVHIDDISYNISEVEIIVYHYSNSLRSIETYFGRIQHKTLLTMRQLEIFFRQVVGVTRNVRTGVSGYINVGIESLMSACLHMNALMIHLLSAETITASSYDGIIDCLNTILWIVEDPDQEESESAAYFPPVDTYQAPHTPPFPPPAVEARVIPNARRNRRKSKALPKAEIDKAMEGPCSICFEPYTRADSVSTCCNHHFCKTCYGSHEKSVVRGKLVTCPMCRKENPVVTEYRARKPRETKPKKVTTIDLTV